MQQSTSSSTFAVVVKTVTDHSYSSSNDNDHQHHNQHIHVDVENIKDLNKQEEQFHHEDQLAADTDSPATPNTRLDRIAKQKEEVVEIPFTNAVLDVFKLYVPIFFATILTFGINRTVCMLIVGQYLSVHEIAVFGIGFTFYTIVGISVPIGFGCGVDLLVGQANGRGRLDEGGQWIQTALVVTSIAMIPSIFIFLFLAGPFLGLFFEEAFTADLASFLRLCVPYVITQTWNLVLSRGLQAQKRADIPTLAAIGGCIFCVLTTWKFIPQYGVNAAPVCLTGAMITQFVITWIYAVYDGETALTKVEAWSPLNFSYWKKVASWERIKSYVSIGAKAALSIVSEWLAVDLVSAFSGALSEVEIAAFGITWIIVTLFFTICLSMSVVTSAFVSNALGANLPKHAEYFSRVCQTCTAFLLILASLFLTAYGQWWFSLFTGGDAATMAVITSSLSAIIIFINLEGIHISIQGLFRGCSTEWLGFTAKVVAFSLWLVGLPGSYLFGVATRSSPFYGIQGLYLGFCSGFLIEIIVLVHSWLFRVSWSELAIEASSSTKHEV
jgi:Na+-driven multidrug efflux pump